MLDHAYETVPYYRDRWNQAGLNRKFKYRNSKSNKEGWNFEFGLSDFQKIPILTKADIRTYGRDLQSYSFNSAELIRKKTSGSTGVSLEIYLDEESRQWKRACALRSDEWTGWRFGEPVAKVWGNPEYRSRGLRGFLRNALLDREFYLDTLHLDETSLARFAQLLVKKRPALIFGHAHSIYLFAQYLQSSGHPIHRPKGIITTAMVLHSWQRRTIEKAFECPVTNRYGCEEVSLIASECEKHQGLHVNADSVFVEVLCTDENGEMARPAQPGETGAVIVTDLTNRAMPIIRYQVGDVAAFSDRICSCGRGLPLLEQLEGREADYVVTPAGELISGISLTENFALHVPGVVQFQIIQEALRQFRFRIVRSPEFSSESLEQLNALVTRHFGPEVEYHCEYLEHIPSEASGKYRFCISRVPNPFTRPQKVAAA